MNNLIVIVDDDKAMRKSLSDYFSRSDYAVVNYASGIKMLADLDNIQAKAIICDLKMPKIDGIQVLDRLKLKPNAPPFIMMTAHGDVPTAVKAIQCGAYGFVEKPFNPKDLQEMIDQAIKTYRLELDNARLGQRLNKISNLDQLLIGQSPAMCELRQQLIDIANTNENILLVGEPGVDKRIIARSIHQHSVQVENAFVEVNCRLATDSLFDNLFLGNKGALSRAKAGIIFLDSLDYLPDESQQALLCLLGSKSNKTNMEKENPRWIGSVSTTPNAAANYVAMNGIYTCLSSRTIFVPALKERTDDVLELFNLYLKQASIQHQTTIPSLLAEDVATLSSYEWPGNQHQLKQIAERFVLLNRSKPVSIAYLLEVTPTGAVDMTNRSNKNLRTIAQDFERQLIIQALIECSGNIAQVCDLLKIPRRTLNEKLLKHHLNRSNFIKI